MRARLAIFLCIAFSFAALVSCTKEQRRLTLAHSTEEPAPSIADIISTSLAAHDLDLSLEEIPNSTDIVRAILDGELDLGIIEEPDHALPGIVTIAPLYPSVLHVLHRKTDDPKDFADVVRNHSVYAGPIGGAAHRLLEQLADDFDVARSQYKILDNPWIVEPDVYFIFGGLLSADSISQLSKFQLYSFARHDDVDGGSVADGIVLKHHHLESFLLPRKIYYSMNDESVVTLAIRSALIANENFDNDLGFKIASHLFNNAQEIGRDYPLVTHELNVDLNAADLMLPLHAGSRRFLERDMPGFVERYVDVIALVLTVVLAILSGLFTLYRRQQQAKKDRVDDYYEKLLLIRDGAEGTSDRENLRAARRQTLTVQQDVLSLLIDERIAADTSLMAFLSLSNQIINELDHRIDYRL